MNKSQSTIQRRLFYGALAAGTAAAGFVVATAELPAYAAAVPMTLSLASGPSGGGNALTGTATATTANPAPFPDGSVLTVQFQFWGSTTGNTACATANRSTATIQASPSGGVTYAGVLEATNVKRVSTTKVAFTVPTALALQNIQTTSKWNVCVYDANANLLSTASYTIHARPKITGITPTSSPSLGGQTITINGSGFATASGATSVTVGGTPLTNVKVASSSSITGTTPQMAATTGLAVVVKTTGGTVSSLDPDNNGEPQDADVATNDAPIPFSFSNGVTVTPNTAPNTAPVDIDIRGVGFQSLNFDPAAADTDEVARVMLNDAAYDPNSDRGVECTGVLVIDDTELICTLPLAGADLVDPADDVAIGTYTVTVVGNADSDILDADIADANASIVSSGSTFTVGPF